MTEKSSPKRRKAPPKPSVDTGGNRFNGANIDPPVGLRWLWTLLFLVAGICVLYPDLVFRNHIFWAGDSQAAFSFAEAGKTALENGVYPGWNPYIFGGMPSFGSMSFLPYVYPVGALLRPLAGVMPTSTWLLIHTLLTGIGTYLVLRDRKVSWVASMAGALAFMWTPHLVAFGANGHGSQACAVAYIPFAILLWERVRRGDRLLLYAALLAIVFGFSMLRAHLQISYYTYLLVGMHLVYFGAWRFVDAVRGRTPKFSALPAGWMKRLTPGNRYSSGAASVEFGWLALILVAVVVASLALSAVLYLPIDDYAQYSKRGSSATGGVDYDYATAWSMHPSELLTFVIPFASGFGKDLYFGKLPFTDYPNYLGAVVFLIGAMTLVLRRNRYTGFLWSVWLFCVLVAFGKHVPLVYNALFEYMPYFDKFRIPVMILILQQFVAAVLFGMGIDSLLRVSDKVGKKGAVIAAGAATVVFAMIVFSQSFWVNEFADSIAASIKTGRTMQEKSMVARVAGGFLFRDLIRISILFVLAGGAAFLYYIRKLPAWGLAGLLLILAGADLYTVNQKIIFPDKFRDIPQYRVVQPASAFDDARRSDGLIEFLQADKDYYRVFPMDSPQVPFSKLYMTNRFMQFGISSLGGYHPAKLALYEEFIEGFASALANGQFHMADFMNVKYFVTATQLPSHPRFELVWRGQNFEGLPRFVYQNSGWMPRVFAVDRHQVVASNQVLPYLASGQVDTRAIAVVEEEPDVVGVSAEGATAEIIAFGLNEIRIKASAPQDCFLVLSEAYYPDWRVTIDGQEAKLLKTNHFVRGVGLPAGEHEVVFYYDMGVVKQGAMISGSTMGVLALLVLLGLFFSRKGRIESADLHSDV